MKTITKQMIEDGKDLDQFENNPECRVTTYRDFVFLNGRSGRRVNVDKDKLEYLDDFLNYDYFYKYLVVYFHAFAQVFVPTVSVGLKLLRSVVDIYNYKTEHVLRYSLIAQILGFSYKEFMSISVHVKEDLLDYPDIVKDVSSTYSEETLYLNGLMFFYIDSKVVFCVKRCIGMFNPNI